MSIMRILPLIAATIAVLHSGGAVPELRVAAAADLNRAFRELAPIFERQNGCRVTLVFGSTGLLARQIEHGAPFDLFAAADEAILRGLETKGRIRRRSRRLYGIGRIVIWSRTDGSLRALKDLASPGVRRIAIANPGHAPYGVAAREALQAAGLWPRLEPRIVYGDNVQQTFEYARTGNVDAAIIALSLAIGSNGRYALVSDKLHSPLRQALGIPVSSRQPALADRFAKLILGSQGRRVLTRYGFQIPTARDAGR